MRYKRTFVIGAALAVLAIAQTPVATVSPTPQLQFFDNNGKPLSGGCVATYAAGTTTPLTSYKDAIGTPNTNPVVLDSSGRASIWIGAVAYKFVLKSKTCSMSAGTVLYTVDGIVDQGMKLRTDLAATNGGGLVGMQQPGGVPITVQSALALCPDASQYASLAAAIANAVPSGCLNVSSVFTAAVTVPSNFVMNCQPGSSISNSTATATITLAATAQNVSLLGCNVSNVSPAGTAIYSPTSCTNCTIQGGSATGAGNGDAIFFNGSWQNIHISNVAASLTGSMGTAIALHCGMASANFCLGAWIENNTVTMGSGLQGIEVGCFCNQPFPVPANIHVMRNHVINTSSTTFASAVSLSTAAWSEVGGNSLDTRGTSFPGNGAYEVAQGFDHINVHDNIWINPNPSTSNTNTLAICNGCSDSIFHHNIGPGEIHVYSGGTFLGPPFTNTNTANVTLSDNILTLPANGPSAGIALETNGAANGMNQINAHDNILIGNNSSTGGLIIANDSGSTTMANFTFENNVVSGFNTAVIVGSGGQAIPGIRLHHNTYIGNATVYSIASPTVPETITDNNQPWVIPASVSAAGLTMSGPVPTFTYGTGAGTGPSGIACSGAAVCSPFKGAVFLVTGTAPAANGLMFSVNVPTGTFAVKPVCVTGPDTASQLSLPLVYNSVGSTLTRLDFYIIGGAAAAGASVLENYVCMK